MKRILNAKTQAEVRALWVELREAGNDGLPYLQAAQRRLEELRRT